MSATSAITRAARSLVRGRPRASDPRQLQIAAGTPFDLGDLLTRPRDRNQAVVQSLCYNAFLGNKTSLCRVLGRFRMYVDTTDLGLSSHLLTLGYWEMWHTEAMARLVRPGMTAVDIGANLGYFTVLMSELVGPSGRVHAFEPNPALAERLRKSVYVNGFAWTTVHELALSDAAGEAALSVPAGDPKNGQIVPIGPGGPRLRVETGRLDALPGLLDADILKIDVEGAEQAVWRGMAGLLESPRPLTIVLEFTMGRYEDPAAFVDQLTRHGFSLEVIDPFDGIVPIDRAWLLSRPHGEDQLVVLRR